MVWDLKGPVNVPQMLVLSSFQEHGIVGLCVTAQCECVCVYMNGCVVYYQIFPSDPCGGSWACGGYCSAKPYVHFNLIQPQMFLLRLVQVWLSHSQIQVSKTLSLKYLFFVGRHGNFKLLIPVVGHLIHMSQLPVLYVMVKLFLHRVRYALLLLNHNSLLIKPASIYCPFSHLTSTRILTQKINEWMLFVLCISRNSVIGFCT